jgi:integrase
LTNSTPAPPKRTGTIFRYAPAKPGEALGHYIVRCSAPDGTRPLFHLDPSPESPEHETEAKKAAGEIAAELWVTREGAAPKGTKPPPPIDVEGMEQWFKVWMADRKRRGYTSTRENDSHYRLHIGPSTANAHVRDWTRDTLRKLSRDLDAKVQADEMAWKMAQNIWGTATKMCDDAAESKDDEIKCRTDNPADGVRGPDRGDELGLQFLYPSEFLQFVNCAEVPLRWRRLVAVAVYLYPRDSELRALECRDVDTEHSMVMITKALDRDRTGTKSTKGKRVRPVPIEAPLLPLLAALKAERGEAGGLMAETPSERDLARGLRRWLWKAGVRRFELHNDTPTTRKLRFHDLRSTGVTWLAVRGDDPLKIQARAGHREFSTTQKYIRLAEMHGASFGTVFPELPASLFGADGGPPSVDPPPSELDDGDSDDGAALEAEGFCSRDSGSVTAAVTSLLSSENYCGADGTRTRGLRRDRPAL